MAVTIWHIWEARNNARNSGEVAHPRRTAAKIKAYVDMILLHLYKPASGQRRETPALSPSWSPPPSGTVLLTSDAAIFSELQKSGLGVVARNHMGQCIANSGGPHT